MRRTDKQIGDATMDIIGRCEWGLIGLVALVALAIIGG
jgi:hypothetical protein